LQQAIAAANDNSPFRASAAAISAAAAETARVAGRPLNPLFEFRTENWTPSSSTSLPLDVWAVVSQPIELGGKRALRRAIAAADHDRAEAALSLVDRDLAMRVTTLYFQALRARATLSTAASSRDGLSTLVDTMRQRLDEGYVAESDLLRFRAEAARLDIDVARAQLELLRNLDALAAILGMTTRFAAEQLVVPASISPPAAGGDAIAAAIERHPEVLAASARIARADRTVALERARRLPDPAVTTGFKQTLGIGTIVAAITTSIPLFDRNDASRATAVGELRAATAERNAARMRLTSEASTLVNTARALADRSRRAQAELLAPSEGVRTAARVAFEEGAVDVLKLIDAERVYADVNRIVLDLQLEATSAAIEARIALGEEPLP
jgi:cobalt-zinc-cadmium efflux system outer membrane protein